MLRPSDCVPGCVLGVSCFSAPHVTVWGRGNSRLSFPVWSCLSMNDGRLMSLTEVTVGGQKHDVQLCVEHFPVTSNSKKKQTQNTHTVLQMNPMVSSNTFSPLFLHNVRVLKLYGNVWYGNKVQDYLQKHFYTLLQFSLFGEDTDFQRRNAKRVTSTTRKHRVLRETINFTALGCFLWKESGTDWTPLFLKLWGRFSHRGFGAVTHRAIPE